MNGKVQIINNAIDLEKFKFNSEIRKQKQEELKIDENTKVIGHIGRFVSQKNHTFLIDVFNEIYKKDKNTILLLIGQGPLEDNIKEKVHSLNLDSNVKFLEQRNDVNELYQVFDLFLLPSLYEGLPVVGIEAQASGLNCIFSDDMTKETKVLDSSKFVSLQESNETWAKIVLDNMNYDRKDTSKEMQERNFDIQLESNKLETKYKELKNG